MSARLLGPVVDRVVSWVGHSLLRLPDDLKPILLDWHRVTAIDVVVHMEIDRDDAGVLRSEQVIWRDWLSRLPFARR